MNRMNYVIFFLVSACASYFDPYLIQTEPIIEQWMGSHSHATAIACIEHVRLSRFQSGKV